MTLPTAKGTTAALLTMMLTACATSHVVIVGQRHPAISPDQVQIYLRPPDSKYESIADLTASSGGSWAFSAGDKINKVIERLKKEAARLGANGILLHGVGNKAAGSVGAGFSTETSNPHTAGGLGFGASTFLFDTMGDGVAIYVEPH